MTTEHTAGDRVLETVLAKLARDYPRWRVTSHITEGGVEVQMIEYANDDGEFASGLPGEFVSIVANHSEKP